jgi:hypothetical protein
MTALAIVLLVLFEALIFVAMLWLVWWLLKPALRYFIHFVRECWYEAD